jgi:hypothetical protein
MSPGEVAFIPFGTFGVPVPPRSQADSRRASSG